MSNIREKISTLLPEAVIEDGDIMQVTVPDAKWHDFAKPFVTTLTSRLISL